MTDYEKIDVGMRLMAEGCAQAKSCEYCPFRRYAGKCAEICRYPQLSGMSFRPAIHPQWL